MEEQAPPEGEGGPLQAITEFYAATNISICNDGYSKRIPTAAVQNHLQE
jgi:hypothetical protein